MKVISTLLAISLLLGACSRPASNNDMARESRPLDSGIDLEGMDRSVRPQDDFFAYANGNWVASNEIPADQSAWGSFQILRDNGLKQLREIVEEAADSGADAEAAKIAAFYAAWIDEDQANSRGLSPVADLLAEIDAIDSHDQVVKFLGARNEIGIDGPLGLYIGQDRKSPENYIVIAGQSGLGLPDRDYYFDDSERGQELLGAYAGFVASLLRLAGHEHAETAAAGIIALESRIAGHHWDKVKNRDANQTYNKVSSEKFAAMLSNVDAAMFLNGLGVGSQDELIVRQPSYLRAFNDLFPTEPVAVWQDYLRLKVLTSFADYLSKDFVDARFDFYGRTLQGRQEQQVRWKRAIGSVNGSLGEMLGRLYVRRHFPPEAKSRMDELVGNLILAYEESIQQLDWMSDETKTRALEKLAQFTPMIGYPEKWRDYSNLDVTPDDLVGNIRSARVFEHYRQIDKLGKPVDKTEWFMPPQTVNAYYSPTRNQIVFPAAILQPPFFDLAADDARNYGAIGLVIGHEIGHGFDDQGSKYDGNGNLRNWWTDDDRSRFEERTSALVAQYNEFEPLPGLNVNGELTLGENIGDLGGAAIALRAYELSLQGNEAPIIDGMTGEERFFLGLAQVWRSKYRDEAIDLQVKSDPHSPPYYRVNGVVPNVDAFYETFDVGPGDAHYLPENERVRIWR